MTVEVFPNQNAALTDKALALQQAMRGQVILPSHPEYDAARRVWNGMIDKYPAMIARCTGVADVIAAVNFAREHNILVAVRGGGHNVAGHATCDGGLVIDLSAMKGIHVDPVKRTARADGGVTWGELDRETQVFGLAAPGGVVSTTGIAGLTLGGGLGWLRRKHGLTIDNLLSVNLVTASGEYLTASENENADLFWGLRGGGGNFGVVTSFEYRLHPVGPMVTLAMPWYPVEDAKELLPKWRDFMQDAPEALSSTAYFWTVPAVPDFPAEYHGKRAVIFGGVYTGPLEEGERITRPLREMGTPFLDLSGHLPWTSIQQGFDQFFPARQRQYYFKSRYLKRLDDDTIDALIPRGANPPSPSILIVIWHNGGAMRRASAETTAFMGRNENYLFSVDAIWDDPAETEDVLAYSRAYLAEMEPYSTGGLYVNFAGLGEEGEQLVKDAYGAHYNRLVALKTRYDPANLFRLNQNIKPAL
ncbi:MAG TPA: FAD-binding oxidoreductase [Aggregatilinea sp.]|uniref:FAD-binding oxidoreductase n=1 Tax=Aggregatilinea sp. TaxID=2806333 RepID=UPI002BFC532D|nr:FAD-binding oxidoreductase [Aggregatilinea sp.]HML22442.1 FAD-binding oxidoreductase [Aggregatilinea sp.]